MSCGKLMHGVKKIRAKVNVTEPNFHYLDLKFCNSLTVHLSLKIKLSHDDQMLGMTFDTIDPW